MASDSPWGKGTLWWLTVLAILAAFLCRAAEAEGPTSRRTGMAITEIMYNPGGTANRSDLKFVELYNADLTSRDLSGFSLSGAWEFVFPTNTVLEAGGYLVVTTDAAALRQSYSITNVLGGASGDLPESGGEIRLASAAGAVLLTINYSDSPPWPEVADGAGHSLVLTQPSYGEGDVRAWSASQKAGGSPGSSEPDDMEPLQSVVINEVLANADSPLLDFVELYNRSASPLNLSGCFLSDSPRTNKFQIPAGTLIPPHGFISFDELQLGFGLKAHGDSLFFRKANGRDALDAIEWGGQSSGVSQGLSPDGVGRFRPLASLTPGNTNSAPLIEDLVINEIMYHPISEDSGDEYIELYNKGAQPIDLSAWRLAGGIEYAFSPGVVIQGKSLLVVAADRERMLARYPNLNPSNTVGNFNGQLSNQGERVVLVRPEFQEQDVTTNDPVWVVVDEVTYQDGGTWGTWADGGGSSLELIDPHSDNEFGSNWADSDESGKSPWTEIQNTGVLDLGRGSIDTLHILAQGAGEYLIDNVEVIDSNGANRVPNSTFESGIERWAMRGTHAASALETQEGFNSQQSLHVRAVARGDTIANRILTQLTSSLTPGTTATIRAKVRWLRGYPEMLLRLYGNYLEAYGRLELPTNLGTPGQPNSRLAVNAGPAITEVRHSPVLPAANQPIEITARVVDADVISQVVLHYRLDPSPTVSSLVMQDDGTQGDSRAGDGLYTATIPGQIQGAMVAFWIEAVDQAATAATNRYPALAPVHEALIRVGEQQPGGSLGTYRLWMTQSTFNLWTSRSKMDNTPLPITFVYNADRAIYESQALFAGSPHISPGYTTPSGRLSGYVVIFPPDEPFLGATEIVLDWPDRDSSKVQEHAVYWMAEQMGLPNLYRRFIRLHVNGVTEAQRGGIYEDAQQVNSDYLQSWHPEQEIGDLHKIEQWFEYDANGTRTQMIPPTLEKFTTTGGALKLARYRWTWLKRAVQDSANNYSNLFDLVQAANLPVSEEYTAQLEVFADIEQWMRIFALEHIIGNFDSYGHQIGKNMYAYKPPGGRWEMHMWDIDWLMNASSGRVSPTSSLFESEDPVISRMYAHPPFRRAYFRAVQDAVYGPLESTRIDAYLDERQAALVANGVAAGSTATGKSWLSQRRAYLLQQLAAVNAPFQITSPAGNVSTNQNWIVLQGAAPVEVAHIAVNGIAYPVTWTTVNAWQSVVPLRPGTQTLQVQGLDRMRRPLSSAQATITASNISVPGSSAGTIVINEILYRSAQTNSEFVEIYNTSTRDLYDLSGWRMQGLDFVFPPGTLIGPNQYRVIARDPQAYTAAFGNAIVLTGGYSGRLDPEGELLALYIPGAQGAPETVVDEILYDDDWPWPSAAAESGASLQLIDPLEDNQRAANWAAIAPSMTNAPTTTNVTVVPLDQTWKYNQTGQDLGTAWREVGYDDAAWPSGAALLYVESAELPATKSTRLTLGPTTYYFRTQFQYHINDRDRKLLLYLVVDDGAVVYLNGKEIYRVGMPAEEIRASTWASRTTGDASLEGPWTVDKSLLIQGSNVLAVEVHQANASSTDVVFGLALESAPDSLLLAYTPGKQNAVRADLASFPPILINEIQAQHTGSPADSQGDSDPWIELYNPSTNTISLDGLELFYGREMTNAWAFPIGTRLASGGYLIVWLDGEPQETRPDELHASFRIGPSGLVGLRQGNPARIIDYVDYPVAVAGSSYGSWREGRPGAWREWSQPSPGTSNAGPFVPAQVRLNEWMASNTQSIADPADGDFEDWFELYNPGNQRVDLSGFRLTDNMTNTTKWVILPGTYVEPGGFLVVWADEESAQNGPASVGLHANFKLSQEGELIALIAPDGTVVDMVTFGQQMDDVSQGRWPDGDQVSIRDLDVPTPGQPNQGSTWPGNFVVRAAAITKDQLLLRWEAETNRTYVIEYKSELSDSDWQPLLTVAAGSAEIQQAVPLGEDGQRFFRVRRVD